MSRINTNVPSLIAQRVLQSNQQNLNTSLQRLSTGLKINSGADDPAGLIASESLKNEQAGITTAIDNANRATNVIGTAEGGLSEVSNLLTQLTGLVGQSANSGGLSADEVNANQLQVDSILSTINRIAGATTFDGRKLLDGTLNYTTTGAATSAFTTVQINSANLPGGKTQSVVVQVTNSATQALSTFGTVGGAAGLAGSAVTIEVDGASGSQQLSFAGSSALSAVVAAVNNISSVTGVTASASGGEVLFKSKDYGSNQFVSVKAVAGAFDTTGKAYGKDADVRVNGAVAQVKGLTATYRDANLDLSLDISSGLNNGQTKTFSITGGGATFSLGSKVTEADKANIGIQSVSTANLGSSVLGFLSTLASGQTNSLSSTSLVGAQKILDTAVNQVSQLRGRLGAFQKYTLGSTINNLGIAYENASSAESAIADTNFASETANLTREQILQQSASTVLSQANSAPQAVLSLLRGA